MITPPKLYAVTIIITTSHIFDPKCYIVAIKGIFHNTDTIIISLSALCIYVHKHLKLH